MKDIQANPVARAVRYNSKVRVDTKTGFKGVSFSRGLYLSRITVFGKRFYLGYYKTAIEAAQAYNTAAILYRKESTSR